MNRKEIPFRKRRDFSAIVTDSFDFLKQEIKPISRILLTYVAPFVILYAGAQVYFQRNILSRFDLSDPETLMNQIGPFYSNLFLFLLFGIFVQSLLMGTFFTYVEAYIKQGKDNFSQHDISGRFFSNSLLALGASLVYALVTLMGLILCFLPGIYISNTLSLAMFMLIFRKKGLNDALSGSLKLVNTQWWNTLALNLVGLLIVYSIGIVLSLPTILFGFTTGMLGQTTPNPEEFPEWYWVWTGFTSGITTLLLIIPYTFQAMQYFNLEERINPKPKIGSDELLS